MSEQNKAVVRRVIEDHWNAKNRALVPELFAPTVTIHTPDGVLNGLDGASALLQERVEQRWYLSNRRWQGQRITFVLGQIRASATARGAAAEQLSAPLADLGRCPA
jgi:uncharacterized protein (DUF3084 family)